MLSSRKSSVAGRSCATDWNPGPCRVDVRAWSLSPWLRRLPLSASAPIVMSAGLQPPLPSLAWSVDGQDSVHLDVASSLAVTGSANTMGGGAGVSGRGPP